MSILGIREELIQRGDAVVAMHSKSSKKSTLQFFGVCVPELRKIAKKNNNLDFDLILRLLNSDYFEEISIGLYILQSVAMKFDASNARQLILESNSFLENWALSDDFSMVVNKWLRAGVLFGPEIICLLDGNHFQRRAIITCWVRYNSKNSVVRSSLALEIYNVLRHDKNYHVRKGVQWFEREYFFK